MALPAVRIDDFVTGVKPIISNHIEKFNKVLHEFESRQIHYVLGIVPALIKKEDIDYLLTLKYMIPALHGYNHNFYTWNGTNNDEFKGLNKEQITDKISKGLSVLSAITDTCSYFIPPFNALNQDLINVLNKYKFEVIATGYGYNNEYNMYDMIPWTPRKIFYGRCYDMIHLIDNFKENDHISLHLTWQVIADEEKKSVLPYLLDKLLIKIKDI